MPVNLLCIICAGIFKINDDAHCTECGHIFHLHCLRQWLSQNFSCPQCRDTHPRHHKIYLTFDNGNDSLKEISELKSKLQKSQQYANDLKLQLQQSKNNLSNLEKRLLNELQDSEEQIQDLRDDLKKSENVRESLEQELNQLSGRCTPRNMSNDRARRSVVLKGIRSADYQMPLKQIVLKLANRMNLRYRKSDIENIFILERNCYVNQDIEPEYLTIVVEFNTLEAKITFLASKHQLRTQYETSYIKIYEYVTDVIYALYRYACKLRNYGFDVVYCRNNMVFAKIDDSPPIRIYTFSQVKKFFNDM